MIVRPTLRLIHLTRKQDVWKMETHFESPLVLCGISNSEIWSPARAAKSSWVGYEPRRVSCTPTWGVPSAAARMSDGSGACEYRHFHSARGLLYSPGSLLIGSRELLEAHIARLASSHCALHDHLAERWWDEGNGKSHVERGMWLSGHCL